MEIANQNHHYDSLFFPHNLSVNFFPEESIDGPPSSREQSSVIVSADETATSSSSSSSSSSSNSDSSGENLSLNNSATCSDSCSDDDDDEKYAMNCSLEASQLLQSKNFEESIERYRRAADFYLTKQDNVIAAVNAAGCFRNMGAVSRLLCNYGDSLQHLQCAEELYITAKDRIKIVSSSITNSEETQQQRQQQRDGEIVTLDLMIIETKQSMAIFYFQYQHDVKNAILCHEECLHLLVELNESSQWDSPPQVVHGVVFAPLSKERHMDLLIVSLENLAGMYRAVETNHEIETDITQFETALEILKDRHRTNPSKTLQPLTKTLRNLSEVFFARNRIDRAVDALHDAMDYELSASEEPSSEALDAMDKMGLANEHMQNYDKAISCYEKALLARSRYYGDDHIDVAKSLINVARVLELQGNNEGSLDLYKAAHSIYALQITSSEFECAGEDAAAILDMIPLLLQQERFEQARQYLTKCLSIADEDEKRGEKSSLDKSQIYYDLGRAYMGLNDFVSSTICLLESAKEEGNVSESEVFETLKYVECMQRKENHRHKRQQLLQNRSLTKTTTIDEQITTSTTIHHRHPSEPVAAHARDLVLAASRDVVSLPPNDIITRSTSDSQVDFGRHSPDTEFSSEVNRVYKQPSLGSTLPTIDHFSDGESHARYDLFHPDKVDGFFKAFGGVESDIRSHKSELSSILFETDTDGLSNVIIPALDESEPLPEDSQTKLAPLLNPKIDVLSDEVESPETSPLTAESNQFSFNQQRAQRKNGRGLRRAVSPRRNRDERSVASQRSKISRVFGDKLRIRRKGFKSLPEDNDASTPESNDLLTEETDSGEESLLFDGPINFVEVKTAMSTDEVSEITARFEDPNTSRDNSQEWWWGVTAEGFGRWFPASYVSQAVRAADAFLSAKAIHSQSKSNPPAATALDITSEDESIYESGSQELTKDFASNVGITSTKASQAKRFDFSGSECEDRKKAPRPHHASVFSTTSPQHFTGGRDTKAEILKCRDTLVQLQKDHGREHPNIATNLFKLAILYSRDHDVEPAIECASEAHNIQVKNGDVEDAARSLHFLADLYLHEKQYNKSLSTYADALKIETSHFGYFSDAAAKTLNCIGTVKLLQNDFREAMESHQEALRILKECYGENLKHRLVSETLCRIGSVYYRERNSVGITSSPDGYTTFIEGGMLEVIGRAHEDRGSYKMAIAFFEEKLQFLESKGKTRDNLEDAATTLNGLGMLSSRAGLYTEAIDYYEKALSIQLQLGCDEVQLATARVLAGTVQFQLGNWKKALNMLQGALSRLKNELGDRHETVAATHYQIGVVQSALCDYDLAMESLNEALAIQEHMLGDDHPATLRTRREIGNQFAIYEADVDTALNHFDFVLKKQKVIHGDRHPNVAETLHSIGCAHAKSGNISDALRYLEECYYMRVEYLGWDHPLQAATLHDIAKIHLKRGRIKKTLHICDVVLGIRCESLSDRHISIAQTLVTKGSALVGEGDTDNAFSCLSDSLEIAKETVDEKHPLIAQIYSEFGSLHLRKCQFELARKSIKKALDIYCWTNLDDDYEGIREVKEKLERVERDELLCV